MKVIHEFNHFHGSVIPMKSICIVHFITSRSVYHREILIIAVIKDEVIIDASLQLSLQMNSPMFVKYSYVGENICLYTFESKSYSVDL